MIIFFWFLYVSEEVYISSLHFGRFVHIKGYLDYKFSPGWYCGSVAVK